MQDTNHTPTRLLVLRDRDALRAVASARLSETERAEVERELARALSLPDDEATLVLATIKDAWEL